MKLFKYIIVLTLFIFMMITSVQLQGQGCNCTEFIYLNEPNADATLKFQINPDGSLTEIINPATPNGHWAEGTTTSPHGIGTDLNGYMYIGNITGSPATRGTDKYDCTGTLVQADAIPPGTGDNTTGLSGYATNIYTVGNTIYFNSWPGTDYFREIVAMDICTGDLLGSFRWCQGSNAWDYHIDEANNQIYINNNQGVFITDLDSLDTGCIPMTFADDLPRGIVVDETGSVYTRDQANLMRKYDANGTLIWEVDLTLNGGANGWGLTYSENGYLYVAGNDADCISIYDTDGNYIMQGAANNGGAGTKAIGITKECCPDPANLVIDTLLCQASSIDVFLQDLINCDGTICEGQWTSDPSNTGIDYNTCNNSIKSNSTQVCGSFSLSSDGSNPMSQCGPISLTINIEFITIPTITATGNQTFCPGDVLTDLVATPDSPTATLQWQMSTTSCAGPWTDIAGATANTYTPTDLSATTYYQAIATETGACATGACDAISECITLTLDDQCYDVSLTKSVNTPTATIGESVTFTIVTENLGSPITGATVNDALPAGLTYNNVYTATTGTYDGTNWTIGNMAAGQIDSIEITAIVDAEGVITNEANVTINETESDLTNNDDKACVSIPIEVCDTEAINISIEAGAGFSNYQWYKDGVLISGATTQTYIATEVGTYTYTVDGAGPTGDCDGELCCPVIIEQISCCPPIQCLPIQVTKLEE